jgi:hypothetical protein
VNLQQLAQDAERAHGGKVDFEAFCALLAEGIKSERSFMIDMYRRLLYIDDEMAEAYQTYADSLNTTVDELTTTDKQIAWMNHFINSKD